MLSGERLAGRCEGKTKLPMGPSNAHRHRAHHLAALSCHAGANGASVRTPLWASEIRRNWHLMLRAARPVRFANGRTWNARVGLRRFGPHR